MLHAFQVIGSTGVTLFDLSKSVVDSRAAYFTIKDVYITYLTHGDSINLFDRSVKFANSKDPLQGHEKYEHALTSSDIFGGGSSRSGRKPEFVRLATSVYDAKFDRTAYGTTFKTHPTFRVTISRIGHDSEGWVERKHSFHSDLTSYKNMYVEIEQD